MSDPETSQQTGPSAFGRWLYESRTRRGLDVASLADRSGVSVPAIYNIESGRSLNPQDKTRRKLFVTLGDSHHPPQSALRWQAITDHKKALKSFITLSFSSQIHAM